DMRAGLGIEHVIAFVLSVMQPEMFLNIMRQWVHLQRQVAPAHGVEKVEADRKFRTETAKNRIAKQGARLREHKIDRRHFDLHGAETKAKAVFFRHAIEAPGKIRLLPIEIANLLHPLSTPWTGIKKRDDAERPCGGMSQRLAECGPL